MASADVTLDAGSYLVQPGSLSLGAGARIPLRTTLNLDRTVSAKPVERAVDARPGAGPLRTFTRSYGALSLTAGAVLLGQGTLTLDAGAELS
jgi:hypothetical protein